MSVTAPIPTGNHRLTVSSYNSTYFQRVSVTWPGGDPTDVFETEEIAGIPGAMDFGEIFRENMPAGDAVVLVQHSLDRITWTESPTSVLGPSNGTAMEVAASDPSGSDPDKSILKFVLEI